MSSPIFGICELTTLPASFEEDLVAYRAAGADAIGICEIKLAQGREREQLASFRDSGLRASGCVPAVPSILPLPPMPGPEEPEERVQAFLAGMRRLAPFQPAAIVCLTGPAGERSEEEVRRIVLEGLSAVAEEAERLGLRVGLEPIHPTACSELSIISTLAQAARMVDEVGSPALGLTFDTWQLWDSPDLLDDIAAYGDRIVAVHVADWRRPTRSWCDRALPGEGAIDFLPILEALRGAGGSLRPGDLLRQRRLRPPLRGLAVGASCGRARPPGPRGLPRPVAGGALGGQEMTTTTATGRPVV